MIEKNMDFQVLRFAGGFNSRRSVSEYLRVNISTVNRWENNEVVPPFAVCELMRVLAGELPTVGRRQSFSGWRFAGDYLYTPNGNRYTSGDIESIFILRQQLRAQQSEINNLTNMVAKLSEQVKPSHPDNVIPFPTPKQYKEIIK